MANTSNSFDLVYPVDMHNINNGSNTGWYLLYENCIMNIVYGQWWLYKISNFEYWREYILSDSECHLYIYIYTCIHIIYYWHDMYIYVKVYICIFQSLCMFIMITIVSYYINLYIQIMYDETNTAKKGSWVLWCFSCMVASRQMGY